MEYNAKLIVTIVIVAVGALLGITILADAVIPMSIDAIGSLTGDDARYNTILYLVPMVAVFGLIVVIVRAFSGDGRS